jgi:hypothetical protein
MTILKRAVKDTEAALRVIGGFFLNEGRYEKYSYKSAATILAELANHNPPLFVTSEVPQMPMVLPLETQIVATGLPRPVAEHQFHPKRKWRFDWAWLDAKLGVEIDGGTRQTGRHNRHEGYSEDCVKLNEAVVLGWRVLRFTSEQVADGYALATITKALEAP